ncbi:MAG: hypothetical protein AB7I19_10355 [Planctomycetota bacterium]
MMKQTHILAILLASTTLAAQQGPTASTSTDFAVLASDGAATNLDSEAQNTAVGRGLGVRTAAGRSRTSRGGAVASTTVGFGGAPGRAGGPRGLTIHESGSCASTDTNASLSCGTSADAPNTQNPTQAAHGIAANWPVAANTSGNLIVSWTARASSGASASASIDVDGDGTADWTGVAGTPDRQSIAVTAGANGVDISIVTNASATLSGAGREGYEASLNVHFVPAGGAVTCTWTAFGPTCVGSLAGSDAPGTRGIQLTLAVTGATANTFGVILFGSQAAAPTPLPGQVCDLLIDANRRGHFAGRFMTDANGDATVTMQVPARAFTIDMQGLTFDRANQTVGSTNGLNLVCR